MKIGLYFGSFNPIHVGHLIIANHMAEYAGLEQVWFVVTPHNPFKKKDTLLNDNIRLELVFLATEAYPKLKPSDVEFRLQQPNYTVHTLAHLKEQFPQHEFALIMGEDNLKSLHKWKNYEVIVDQYPIFVYPRIESESIKVPIDAAVANHLKIHFIAAPVVEISSTFVRNAIKENKNVRPLLPEKVWAYIDHNNLYKK